MRAKLYSMFRFRDYEVVDLDIIGGLWNCGLWLGSRAEDRGRCFSGWDLDCVV